MFFWSQVHHRGSASRRCRSRSTLSCRLARCLWHAYLLRSVANISTCRMLHSRPLQWFRKHRKHNTGPLINESLSSPLLSCHSLHAMRSLPKLNGRWSYKIRLSCPEIHNKFLPCSGNLGVWPHNWRRKLQLGSIFRIHHTINRYIGLQRDLGDSNRFHEKEHKGQQKA